MASKILPATSNAVSAHTMAVPYTKPLSFKKPANSGMLPFSNLTKACRKKTNATPMRNNAIDRCRLMKGKLFCMMADD